MINFKSYYNITKVVIPNSVTLSTGNFSNAFQNSYYLTSVDFNHSGITNMYRMYMGCNKLTGSPVCGENVTDMVAAYNGCRNLTGSPVCGNNVTSLGTTYYRCMNLTGSPVCGNKVTSMLNAYYDCHNLTGSPVCGKSVINMQGAYYGCYNLSGNAYFYSDNINNARSCFAFRNAYNRLNIYVKDGSKSLNTLVYNNSTNIFLGTGTIVGTNRPHTLINDVATNGCYYSEDYNTYIYPVPNVEEARVLNRD